MSEEIKSPNGTTVKLGAKGEPLQGTQTDLVTPASLDELLKEWEADATANKHHCRCATTVPFTTEHDRILSLIAVVRKQREKLLFISTAGNPDCQEALQKYADEALTEAERILKG